MPATKAPRTRKGKATAASVQGAEQAGNLAGRGLATRFRPGVSGNPGGKPKGLVGRVRENTRDGILLIDRLVEIVKTGKDSDVVSAAGLLFQRGWGKAPQTMTLKTRPPRHLAVIEVINRLPQDVVSQVCAVLQMAELPESEPRGNPS